jgi:hypothetical protein
MNLSSEILFTLGDLKRLFLRRKHVFKRVIIFSALLVFVYLSFKEPRFQATATFRQSQGSDENVGKLRNLINVVMLSEQDRGAASLMLSQRLGRMVVEKLGMQAQVGGSNFVVRNISNFWRNLSTELGFSQREAQNFVFRDLFYDGERGLALFCVFMSRRIRSSRCEKAVVAKGDWAAFSAGKNLFYSSSSSGKSLTEKALPTFDFTLDSYC